MRPTVLTIAGFDPSAGAGVLADIKTFEALKTYGLGVVSALTWQNESEFEKTEWISADKIIHQTEILLRKSKIEFAKIGLIENWETFGQIIDFLKNHNINIIWDPVLKAIVGFDFHSDSNVEEWKKLLPKIFLVTPNWEEAKWITSDPNVLIGVRELSSKCHFFLKGGHNSEKPGYDYLFIKGETKGLKEFSFRPKVKDPSPKHGTGCVLSAALTSLLAKGYGLKKAGLMAKEYVAKYMVSNNTLLGYHKF